MGEKITESHFSAMTKIGNQSFHGINNTEKWGREGVGRGMMQGGENTSET